MSNPIHEENGEWYFCDETWADRYGPYDSEEITREALTSYCKICLDGDFYLEPKFVTLLEKEN